MNINNILKMLHEIVFDGSNEESSLRAILISSLDLYEHFCLTCILNYDLYRRNIVDSP